MRIHWERPSCQSNLVFSLASRLPPPASRIISWLPSCRIELLDTVARKIKILYLQNNLIPKIENVGRLKELNYLNLALNNVTKIEGLQGCEMLEKLDLTVNFVGDLTGVVSLQVNRNLKILYLTGNPCALYEGYREYVAAKLPQLRTLDGIDITKSERIQAVQQLPLIEARIIRLSAEHTEKLDAKAAYRAEKAKAKAQRDAGIDARRAKKVAEGRKAGPKDGDWYHVKKERPKIVEIDSDYESSEAEDSMDEDQMAAWWQADSEFDPESRYEAAVMSEKQEAAKNKGNEPKKKKVRRNFFRADGKALNINEGGWGFLLEGQQEPDQPYVLDLACYKHLSTSEINLDVQPHYVRCTIKEKVFQLSLTEEVSPDSGKAERSEITGHLQVTMPKLSQLLSPKKEKTQPYRITQDNPQDEDNSVWGRGKSKKYTTERLEVGEGVSKAVDVGSIVSDAEALRKTTGLLTLKHGKGKDVLPRANDENFVDDDDVPPLC